MKRRYVEAETEVIHYVDKDVILTSAGEPDPQCLGDTGCEGGDCDNDGNTCSEDACVGDTT